MQTTDTGLLFQTSADVASSASRDRKVKAAEKIGNPIRLSSKILDLCIHGDVAFTAESGWIARKIDLNTGETRRVFRGHKGPVTSVALAESSTRLLLFTGSWDKTVRVWDAESGLLLHTLAGHMDFVKSLLVIASPPLLLSSSSDRTVRLWSLQGVGNGSDPLCLQTIKDHTRPVDCLARRGTAIFTADSMGVIKEYRIEGTALQYVRDLPSHETSVSDLAVSEDGLWSASVDHSAVLQTSPKTVLLHPSAVKCILPLDYTITGSDDEDIRVWDGERCISVVSGHCDAITALRAWGGLVISASLDGTLRRWSMKELLQPTPLSFEETDLQDPKSAMTEEEERELEDLLTDEE